MTLETGLLIGVVFIIVLAVVLIIVGQRMAKNRADNEDPLASRLAEYSSSGEAVSLEEIEMSQPFSERVIMPLLRQLAEMSSRFTPQSQLQEISLKLELAGKAGKIDAPMLLASRFVVAAVAFVGGFIILNFTAAAQPFARAMLITLVLTVVGFFFPQLWLSSEIGKRQKEIRKAMPDALDLLTICVEAGLGFDAAISKVAEKWDNELSLAFGRVIREIQLGKVRRDALRDMSERIGLPEMTSFVAAVIQSEQLGVSMAKVLRIQSDQMRMRRRQMAEEEAHQAPVKMLLPMVAFIFPSIFIVLLTPAALRVMALGLGQ
jgi:tight adherence protein C